MYVVLFVHIFIKINHKLEMMTYIIKNENKIKRSDIAAKWVEVGFNSTLKNEKITLCSKT